MTSIRADEVRIPRHVREAVGRHERVVVFNRERPVLVMVHPDDVTGSAPGRRGRPVADVAAALAAVPAPDPRFAEDMDSVLATIGPDPGNPWEPS